MIQTHQKTLYVLGFSIIPKGEPCFSVQRKLWKPVQRRRVVCLRFNVRPSVTTSAPSPLWTNQVLPCSPWACHRTAVTFKTRSSLLRCHFTVRSMRSSSTAWRLHQGGSCALWGLITRWHWITAWVHVSPDWVLKKQLKRVCRGFHQHGSKLKILIYIKYQSSKWSRLNYTWPLTLNALYKATWKIHTRRVTLSLYAASQNYSNSDITLLHQWPKFVGCSEL